VQSRPWLMGDDQPVAARVRVDAGHADAMLAEFGADATVVDEQADATVIEVAITNRAAFRVFVLGFLDHAEVLEPAELRDDIVGWLETVAKSTS